MSKKPSKQTNSSLYKTSVTKRPNAVKKSKTSRASSSNKDTADKFWEDIINNENPTEYYNNAIGSKLSKDLGTQAIDIIERVSKMNISDDGDP